MYEKDEIFNSILVYMQWSMQKASSAEWNIIYSVIYNGCMYEYIYTPGTTTGLRQWFSDEQGMYSLISGY